AYSDLQAYGCDEGWTNHGEHCYLLVGSNAGADSARLSCQAMGSSLASVWSQVEKDFILSLWRVCDVELFTKNLEAQYKRNVFDTELVTF
ncbi:hypothetical protein BgiBS90_012011, partial [Biomphalaria glabrata]